MNTTSETVRFGFGPTPVGTVLVAMTERGVCALYFPEEDEREAVPAWLHKLVPGGTLVEDAEAVEPIIRAIADWLQGGPEPKDVPLDLRGTDFQQSVWEALREIPAGTTRTYGELARRIGNPKASRAVGAACGANPVSVFVPCHRAIGSNGGLVNYRWGLDRKRALLDREAGRTLPLFSR